MLLDNRSSVRLVLLAGPKLGRRSTEEHLRSTSALPQVNWSLPLIASLA
jgi:hypothetical protein